MKTLVLANQKGGVGKSAVATLLAHHFAQTGQRVLVIDLDHQANLTSPLVRSKRPAVAGITGRPPPHGAGAGDAECAVRARPFGPCAAGARTPAAASQRLRAQPARVPRSDGRSVRRVRDRHQPEPRHPRHCRAGVGRLRACRRSSSTWRRWTVSAACSTTSASACARSRRC